jgi:eukaryotic-like serine/threonine-protein kinase
MADTPGKSKHEPPTDVVPVAGHNTNADSLTEATRIGQPHAPTAASHVRFAPGQMLGVYRLEKKLGEGGMGAVWKAQHTKLGKTVALKVLPRQLTSNPDSVGRFEREMKAVGLLDHPHIIRAMDAGEIDGTHFLVMEYADGVDLAEVVRQRGPRKVRDACEMIRQAALGLGHAHQHGLIHRDIKPTNLFLTKAGQVKILDLGLARLQGEDVSPSSHDPTITRMGQIMGTPDYMATEQWDDTHSVDGRADLYSLGCTLFFLLAGPGAVRR